MCGGFGRISEKDGLLRYLMDNNNELSKVTSDELVIEDAAKHPNENAISGVQHHGRHHSGHHGGHHSYHHSSHGSRHHGSHHKHRRRSSKRKKKKINKKIIWAVVITLAVIIAIFVIVFENSGSHHVNYGEHESGALPSNILSVEVINEDGRLVKDAVSQYLLADLVNPENANVIPSSFSNGDGRLDAQVPVALKLSVKGGKAISYTIELADNDLFIDAETSYIGENRGTNEFKHLYANTTYYYRVTAYTSSGSDSVVGHFKTSDTPRILSIDGLYNVRDIGNWQTDSGKRIKQGLLIRGTEMDGAVESKYHLTNEGLIDMLEVFDIKTDIDLRAKTTLSKDALGACVEHNYYDMVMYDGVFTDKGKERVRTVFAELADPDNYPIYLHCTYGCDRTGIICYLLEAMLGVSRGDCLKDYGLSGMFITNIQVIETGLKAYEGDTLKEQAESYLLSCGVSEYQIESIRNIFLGE